jgi:hypothetical protein
MTGSIQLVATGAMDKFISGGEDASITYFRKMSKKHTNFAMEHKYLQATTSGGQTQTFNIERDCDLISGMYVRVKLPKLSTGTYVDCVGFAFVKEAKLSIGGQIVDTITSHSMMMWEELTASKNGKALGKMIGRSSDPTGDEQTLYVPLNFWFCQDYSVSLPLVALAYHSIKLTLKFADLKEIANALQDGTAAAIDGNANLYSDISINTHTVLLDTAERTQFASGKFDVLFNQHQHHEASPVSSAFSLDFNHPCSQIMWCITNPNEPGLQYKTMNGAPSLKLNNKNRFDDANDVLFFREVQAHAHYSSIPAKEVYVYSFALNPEDTIQPSGSINFSRIDNVKFNCPGTSGQEVHIVARNWNMLRIQGGMGGAVFAN